MNFIIQILFRVIVKKIILKLIGGTFKKFFLFKLLYALLRRIFRGF